MWVGNKHVGKSSAIIRFIDGTFREDTFYAEFYKKSIDVNGEAMNLQIWDLCSNEIYRSITPSYYRGPLGILVLYDVTDRDSFENWIRKLNKPLS